MCEMAGAVVARAGVTEAGWWLMKWGGGVRGRRGEEPSTKGGDRFINVGGGAPSTSGGCGGAGLVGVPPTT